jgi:hypothetical protein
MSDYLKKTNQFNELPKTKLKIINKFKSGKYFYRIGIVDKDFNYRHSRFHILQHINKKVKC